MSASVNIRTLDHSTTEKHFATIVDEIKNYQQERSNLLVELLSERHPVFKNRSTNTVTRLRGYTMASFETTGLPNAALPYVLDALENSFDAYLVASAAIALRGTKTPQRQAAPYLLKAAYNIWQSDAPVNFDHYDTEWPLKKFTTGLTEIFNTLTWMGPVAIKVLADLEYMRLNFSDVLTERGIGELERAIDAIKTVTGTDAADCCDIPIHSHATGTLNVDDEKVQEALLEDQNGERIKWKDFFHGKISVVAFFYSRCTNPRKCTLTIYNLVDIQKGLEDAGLSQHVRTAAISYDPQYDTSEVLKSYGTTRRFRFDDNHRMFRIPSGFDRIVNAFQLRVNFTGSQVNEHRIEIFILNPRGEVVSALVRFQSEPQQIITELKRIFENSKVPIDASTREQKSRVPVKTKIAAGVKVFNSFLLPVIIAFFPKCPLCWASYMSLLGVAGLGTVPYSPWLVPIVLIMLSINLFILYKEARARNGVAPFIFSCLGTALLVLVYFKSLSGGWTMLVGVGLIAIGTVLNRLNYRTYNKLKLVFLNASFHWRRRTNL